MNSIINVEESRFKRYFSSESFLPNVKFRPFIIHSLDITVEYNPANDTALWIKKYVISKVSKCELGGNDTWWEITGCPDGEFIRATNENSNAGLAHESFLDFKDNLIHYIDLGKEYDDGEKFEITTKFLASNLKKENKIVEMQSSRFFKQLLFRVDYASSVPINKLTWKFILNKGIVVRHWPGTISDKLDEKTVVFEKSDLRPRELLTPLVEIYYGSKTAAILFKYSVAFVIGIVTAVVANGVWLITTNYFSW